MKKVSAVLFDFGMVLSGPPSAKGWAAMGEISGLDESTLQRNYWAHRDDYDRGALDGDAYWKRVADDAGTQFSKETRKLLQAADLELWTEMNEPMLLWVQKLHTAGIRTGILSNMGDMMARGLCSKLDWIGDFHHTVWSYALKMRKPEPAIYAAAANGLGLPAGEILFLDDKEENVRAAEEFGMQGLVYSTHADFQQQMQRCGYEYLLDPKVVVGQAASSLQA